MKKEPNSKRFIYFYFNRNEPERVKQFVPEHIQYWESASMQGFIKGPFGDHTGGSIAFSAASLEEAMNIVSQDPFVKQDLIAEKWVKEWMIEEAVTHP